MIDTHRLYDIEVAAQSARTLADKHFTDLGITLEHVCDMALVAMVLTSGTADSTPNLMREGVRLAGVLEGSPLCPTILFEQFDPVVRQRFSLAHELGHYFLRARRNESSVRIAYQRCDQRRGGAGVSLNDTQPGDSEWGADAVAGVCI